MYIFSKKEKLIYSGGNLMRFNLYCIIVLLYYILYYRIIVLLYYYITYCITVNIRGKWSQTLLKENYSLENGWSLPRNTITTNGTSKKWA